MPATQPQPKTGFIKEFKKFAVRGNAIDLAVGVIVGTAFNKIITSLVDDIIMPVIGQFVGNTDFSYLYVALDGQKYESLDAAREAAAPILAYGNFIQVVIDFLIISFSVFVAVKVFNMLKAREEEKQDKGKQKAPKDIQLLTEIRDLLKKSKK